MARGWESKSVEAQQADAADSKNEPKQRLTAEQAAPANWRECDFASAFSNNQTTRDPRLRSWQPARRVDKKILRLGEN
jgi:hypothetical protein